MRNSAEVTINLKKALEHNPSVIGLVLVGSQVREAAYKASQYSDLEAYIIVNDKAVESLEKQLIDLVKGFGEVVFSYKNRWAGFSTLYDDLFRLELPLVKQSEIASIFSRPKAQVVKVIFDRTNGELERVLNTRPETIDFQKFFQDVVEDFWYMIVLCVQYYKKGEIWNARHALEVIPIPSLIKLFELLEDPNILLLESNKRIEQFISKEKLEILKVVSPSYVPGEIRHALTKIIEVFSKTSEEVSEKYNYMYNREIQTSVKPKLIELLDET